MMMMSVPQKITTDLDIDSSESIAHSVVMIRQSYDHGIGLYIDTPFFHIVFR
jgi:hypothetical protein